MSGSAGPPTIGHCWKLALLSAQGKKFDQAKAREYAGLNELLLICGRYEGVDERVAEHLADEEISIGDYVLSGGEIAAYVFIDAILRNVPGVLGANESLSEESFTGEFENDRTRSEFISLIGKPNIY